MTLLSISYMGLSGLVLLLLVWLASKARQFGAHFRTGLALTALLGWQLYIFLVASTGFLQDFSFPPKFALCLIIPAFLFCGVFAFTHRRSRWLDAMPISRMVYFQTFRVLVEWMIAYSVVAGVLHREVSIHGYNFDLIFAATAPILGYWVSRRRGRSVRLVLYWNYLGLIVLASIIFVFMTTLYQPQWYGATTGLLPKEAGQYPFVLLAGFLMPSAVFMHVLSIVKLSRARDSQRLIGD